jgi:hypothetical protein
VVWRPRHGVSASFNSMNYFLSGAANPQSAVPPVRMKQLVEAALDPRWGTESRLRPRPAGRAEAGRG